MWVRSLVAPLVVSTSGEYFLFERLDFVGVCIPHKPVGGGAGAPTNSWKRAGPADLSSVNTAMRNYVRGIQEENRQLRERIRADEVDSEQGDNGRES